MGKHDVIHASDLNDEQLTFENLRYLYGTGRSYVISGSGKYRKMGYRMGVQTELGDLEESEWQQLMRALIEKAGEQELHLQLLQWVTNHCAWLHSRSEREMEALVLHSMRVFQNPNWGGCKEFTEETLNKMEDSCERESE